MRKDLGALTAVFPMPVAMIAAYDADGKVNVMNAAWVMIADYDRIALFIDDDHKTSQNILISKAFTVSMADAAHIQAADFFGIASGNKVHDKFERTGLHAVKSEHVNAPIITDFPICIECELIEVTNCSIHAYVGKIVSVSADASVIDANGKVDPVKLKALIFDPFQHGYYTLGTKVGEAFADGKALMKDN